MKLKAIKREKGQGFDKSISILGNVYGPEVKENENIFVDLKDFDKIFIESGHSTIIDLELEGGESYEVLVKEIQRDPLTDVARHVDFYSIKRGEEIEVSVSIEFVGESEAVKKGGILNTMHSELSVKAMPRNLPSNFEVDLSKLEKVGDSIKISDIILPEGVIFSADDLSAAIVNISEAVTAKEEEEKSEGEPVFENDEEEGEGEGEEKKED